MPPSAGSRQIGTSHKVVCNVTTPYTYSSTNLFAVFSTPDKSRINCQAKMDKVWAVADSLATTTAIVVYFLFLALLRCFSSGGYLLRILYIQIRVTRHDSSRVSPFGHLRIKTYLAVPRSFSQLIASFIGIVRQGILCVRLCNFLRWSTLASQPVQLTSYWYTPVTYLNVFARKQTRIASLL